MENDAELKGSEDFLDDAPEQSEKMADNGPADKPSKASKFFTEANLFDNSIFPVFNDGIQVYPV
jgi:hypothetical protein